MLFAVENLNSRKISECFLNEQMVLPFLIIINNFDLNYNFVVVKR